MNRKALERNVDALVERGDILGASRIMRQLTDYRPEDAVRWIRLGLLHVQRNEIGPAIECCAQAVEIDPASEQAQLHLAMLCGVAGQHARAKEHFTAVLSLNPENVEALVKLGVLEYYAGRREKALRLLEQAKSIDPDNAELNYRFAEIYRTAQDTSQASAYLLRADQLAPDNPEIRTMMAVMALDRNQTEEAYRLVMPFVENGRPFIRAVLLLADCCKKLDRCDEILTMLTRSLNQGLTEEDEMRVCFAIGKMLDSDRRYHEAFSYYRHANDLHAAGWKSDDERRFVDDAVRFLGRKYFTALKETAAERHTVMQPVFIVGMPRSGTTLAEQILARHPCVYAAGERTEMGDISRRIKMGSPEGKYPGCLVATGTVIARSYAMEYAEKVFPSAGETCTHVTDKMPHNYLHVGLIKLLFPHAKIIHCTRSAADVCLSNYFTYFQTGHAYSYDLDNIVQKYLLYHRLIQHWHDCLQDEIRELRYEALVESPKKEIAGLLAYCGLEWADECLSFHCGDSTVITASREQVRQPLHKRSVGRWRCYKRETEAIRRVLEKQLGQSEM